MPSDVIESSLSVDVPLPPAISLVMRSKDEAWALVDTLPAIFDQDYEGEIEFLCCDSGSQDGSVELIEKYQPHHFLQIEPLEYVPGKVLNWGMKTAKNNWVVFLNSDATPANRQWLSELLRVAVSTENLGTAFGRQIPRPDAYAVYAHDYERCFGQNRESAQWPHFFSMVSCVVNKSVWEREPFREDLQYAEDDEWSRRLKKAGYAVAFAPCSIAIHSHNYTFTQAYRRSFGDAKAAAATSMTPRSNINYHHTVFLGALRDIARDWKYLASEGRRRAILHAAVVRFAQRLGRHDGFHEGLRYYQRV